ncbi:MAG: DUF393 domain-containing protein [Pseudomonadota bacterium]
MHDDLSLIEGNLLVYDGDCPLCTRYVKLIRLRDSIGEVDLVNARTDHPAVASLARAGYDLNEGLALIESGQVYFGAACMTRLALLSTPVGLFNRMNVRLFRSPRVAAWLYPFLKAGRNALLWLLGRKPIVDREMP